MVVEGDDGFGDACLHALHHGRHKDFPGFDVEFIKGAGADDVNSDDFVSGIEGYDAEFFDRFGFKIEEVLKDLVADQGIGDWVVFEVITMVLGADLFEDFVWNKMNADSFCPRLSPAE